MRDMTPRRAVGQQALHAVSVTIIHVRRAGFLDGAGAGPRGDGHGAAMAGGCGRDGGVTPEGEAPIALPERCRYEFELERLTSSETGEVRHELEVEIRWTT